YRCHHWREADVQAKNSSALGGAVKPAISALHQSIGRSAVRAGEVMQRGKHATGGDSEHCAQGPARQAGVSSAIKVAVTAQYQTVGSCAIIGNGERMQGGEYLIRADFVHSTKTRKVCASIIGGPIEIAVPPLHQVSDRPAAVISRCEVIEVGDYRSSINYEHAALLILPSPLSSAIEIAVAPLHKLRVGHCVEGKEVHTGKRPILADCEQRSRTTIL